jgi:hypothetical protein
VNIKHHSDRLDILLTRCEEEIRETQERLRALKARRDNLALLAQESEKLVKPKSQPDKFREVGITQAAYEAIKDLYKIRRHAIPTHEVKTYLLAHGFRAPDNFDTAIYTVLKRLVDDGRVIADESPKARTASDGQKTIRIPRRRVFKPHI